MTKKHFEMLARYMSNQRPLFRDADCYRQAVNHLSYCLHSENPRFDADRFAAACGI